MRLSDLDFRRRDERQETPRRFRLLRRVRVRRSDMSTAFFTSGQHTGQKVTSLTRGVFFIRPTKRAIRAPHLSQARSWNIFTQRMSLPARPPTIYINILLSLSHRNDPGHLLL